MPKSTTFGGAVIDRRPSKTHKGQRVVLVQLQGVNAIGGPEFVTWIEVVQPNGEAVYLWGEYTGDILKAAKRLEQR